MMGEKTSSQEYEFSESEDSPVRKYRPLRQIIQNIDNTRTESNVDKDKIAENTDSYTLYTSPCEVSCQSNHVELQNKPLETEQLRNSRPYCSESDDSTPKPFVLRTQRQVVYVWSEELIEKCDSMLKIPMRASMVSTLIQAYSLEKLMSIETPSYATLEEMSVFHGTDYLEFLQKISSQEDEDKYGEESMYYGLGYDCPAHTGVYEYTSLVCGATLKAAQCLMENSCDVAINWYGGWHHGKKDSASGFCYTNDLVLGILALRQKFSRVLYVDLDLHHGDGVEDAFSTTNKVFTVSVHKYIAGFFPGTGGLSDIGYGKGKNHCVNIPLKDGIKDQEFSALVCSVLLKVKEIFQPDVVVCQCGADGLIGDPMESFNLTPRSLGKCVYTLLSWKIPLLLLGGGGYNHANTARCWTYLTGVVLGKRLSSDIPDHQFLMDYGPNYTVEMTAGNMKDENTPDYLQTVFSSIICNLNQLKS